MRDGINLPSGTYLFMRAVHERSLPGARGAKPPMSPDNSKMFTEELQRTQRERESES